MNWLRRLFGKPEPEVAVPAAVPPAPSAPGPRVTPNFGPRLKPLTRITMPHGGEPPRVLAPGVVGLRYADETGIYITWISAHPRGQGLATQYLAAQRRQLKRIVVVEALDPAFVRRLQRYGFVERRLRLPVWPLPTPEICAMAGEDYEQVVREGSLATCQVWEPQYLMGLPVFQDPQHDHVYDIELGAYHP